ncbi:MAG: DUF1015 domain-containing protein, partial [Verrucomicrobiota bacterium]
MITIRPLKRALVPVNSETAERVSAPNYDEFQGDREVWDFIQNQPDCVLKVTMAHCDFDRFDAILEDGSEAALERSTDNMAGLVEGAHTREIEGLLWIYEITRPGPQPIRQIGLGGLGRVDEIRTDSNPDGNIIRNEGIREPKARGRADLIRATNAYIGTVNNAIDDTEGKARAAFEAYAEARAPDLDLTDEQNNQHRIWYVTDEADIASFQQLLADEPCAYVADGNHRSAAAAMLNQEEFLTVFFPAQTMGIFPYNRLVDTPEQPIEDILNQLKESFEVEPHDGPPLQPESTHTIGFYGAGSWFRLTPRPGTYDPDNAVEDIDANITQRKIFDDMFGIVDPADKRMTYV